MAFRDLVLRTSVPKASYRLSPTRELSCEPCLSLLTNVQTSDSYLNIILKSNESMLYHEHCQLPTSIVTSVVLNSNNAQTTMLTLMDS